MKIKHNHKRYRISTGYNFVRLWRWRFTAKSWLVATVFVTALLLLLSALSAWWLLLLVSAWAVNIVMFTLFWDYDYGRELKDITVMSQTWADAANRFAQVPDGPYRKLADDTIVKMCKEYFVTPEAKRSTDGQRWLEEANRLFKEAEARAIRDAPMSEVNRLSEFLDEVETWRGLDEIDQNLIDKKVRSIVTKGAVYDPYGEKGL